MRTYDSVANGGLKGLKGGNLKFMYRHGPAHMLMTAHNFLALTYCKSSGVDYVIHLIPT